MPKHILEIKRDIFHPVGKNNVWCGINIISAREKFVVMEQYCEFTNLLRVNTFLMLNPSNIKSAPGKQNSMRYLFSIWENIHETFDQNILFLQYCIQTSVNQQFIIFCFLHQYLPIWPYLHHLSATLLPLNEINI